MDERLEKFFTWCKENGIQFRGCTIKQSSAGGFGVYSGDEALKDVLIVTPLAMSLTAVTLLKDPLLGSQYREMLENDVDDRLLVIIFLIIERARGKASFWAPYLELLPSEFGTPMWFDEDELMQLDGTTLFDATKAQLRSLTRIFEKVKSHSEAALSSIGLNTEIPFKDFLWANCIFWTRALSIPWPTSFLDGRSEIVSENLCVEGLVPGIDFCNHLRRSSALWEVDGEDGSASGVPHSMYLTGVPDIIDVVFPAGAEIFINYGDKGNEELLFLYGFVEEDNPNDYVMLHFPKEFMEQDPSMEYKLQFLQELELSTRWLVPGSLLTEEEKFQPDKPCSSYSWSGVRRAPAYLNSVVFPEEMISSLRVLAMSESNLQSVALLLEQLSHIPSKEDIQAAVWETCGDSQAFKLLVDMLSEKMKELLRGTGSESEDERVLENDRKLRDEGSTDALSGNHRASVIYRRGQKRLVSRFLNRAEQVLAASLAEVEIETQSRVMTSHQPE